MLTDRMLSVSKKIEKVLMDIFPEKYLQIVFSGGITVRDIINQILFECCKYAYDRTEEKRSLRSYLKDPTADDYRMMLQRTLEKIYGYRTDEYEYLKTHSGIDLPDLLPPPMENIDERKSGYKLNKLQFWEINNVHDMRLVTAIADRRISNKNFTNETFKTYASEYDCKILNLIDKGKAGEADFVFSSLAVFILEWKYSFDFYYAVAEEMEKSGISDIPDMKKRCSLFCGRVVLDSVLNFIDTRITDEVIFIESRLVLLRDKFIADFVHMPEGYEFEDYREALIIVDSLLKRMTLGKENIQEWFKAHSTLSDWVSVMSEYNVSRCFIADKSWDNKKIRFVKRMYSQLKP